MKKFWMVLIGLPIIEIVILLSFGKMLGVWITLLLLLMTGAAGVLLAKKQGLELIRKAQMQMNGGQLPGDELIDGICILAAGLLLLVPGFLTDAAGIALLLPPVRKGLKPVIFRSIRRKMRRQQVTIIQH